MSQYEAITTERVGGRLTAIVYDHKGKCSIRCYRRGRSILNYENDRPVSRGCAAKAKTLLPAREVAA